jgi:hypothetical protein
MAYIVELRQQDNRWEFEKKEDRDAFAEGLALELEKLGVPEEKSHITKIDSEYSKFLGKDVEKVVEELDNPRKP